MAGLMAAGRWGSRAGVGWRRQHAALAHVVHMILPHTRSCACGSPPSPDQDLSSSSQCEIPDHGDEEYDTPVKLRRQVHHFHRSAPVEARPSRRTLWLCAAAPEPLAAAVEGSSLSRSRLRSSSAVLLRARGGSRGACPSTWWMSASSVVSSSCNSFNFWVFSDLRHNGQECLKVSAVQ